MRCCCGYPCVLCMPTYVPDFLVYDALESQERSYLEVLTGDQQNNGIIDVPLVSVVMR